MRYVSCVVRMRLCGGEECAGAAHYTRDRVTEHLEYLERTSLHCSEFRITNSQFLVTSDGCLDVSGDGQNSAA